MRAFCNILAVAGVIMVVGFAGSVQAALVGYWAFDQLNGIATPNGGLGGTKRYGFVQGGAVLESNVSDSRGITRDSAMLFDGIDDQVEIYDGVTKLHAGAPHTIAAWIKTTGQNQAILGKDRGGIWEQGASTVFTNLTWAPNWYNLTGKDEAYVGAIMDGTPAPGGGLQANPPTDGNWHHIAVTSRADTGPGNLAKIYIDGVDVSGSGRGSSWWTLDPGNMLRIGNSMWAAIPEQGFPGVEFFTGHIDDVAIYNQALSADQIQTLMNSGPQDFTVPQTTPGPVSLWGVDVTFDQYHSWGAHGLLYDDPNGWAIGNSDLYNAGQDPTEPAEAILTAEQPLSLGGLTELIFTIKSENYPNFNLGRFRLSITTDAQVEFDPPPGEDDNWIELVPRSVESAYGTTLNILDDNSILASGYNPVYEILTVTAWTDLDNITGYRLEALEDPSLDGEGPGRAGIGNFAISYFGVEAALVPEPTTWAMLGGLLTSGYLAFRWRRRVAA